MKKTKVLFAACSVAMAQSAYAVTVSRIDVTGNQRMDAESVRILTDVKVGDTCGTQRINEVA